MPKNFSGLKINLRGINKIHRAMQPQVDELGAEVVANADGNYEYVANPHKWGGRGHVQTADEATAKKDAESNELLQALGRTIQ